jgi:hypothetical protein
MKRLLLLVTTLLCLAVPATALAYNPLDNACHSGVGAGDSSACSANGKDPISGPHGALRKVSLIIATIAGVAAVIIIIIGGLQYITSGGDPQKAAGARNAIIGAAVGLVIIVAAESIIVFVVSKL